MPLDKTCSLDAMSKNISQSVKDGKPQQQAVAISYSVLKKACGVEGEQQMTPKEIVAAGGKKEGTTEVRFGMTETTPASFMKGLKGTPKYMLGKVKGVEPKESVKAIVDELPKVLKDFPYLSMLKTVGVDIEAENKDEVLVTLNYDGKDVAAEFESYPGVENEQGAHRVIHSSIHKDLKAKLGGSKFTTTNEDDTVDATSSRGAWIMLHVKPSDFGLKVESVTKRVRIAFGTEPIDEQAAYVGRVTVPSSMTKDMKKVITQFKGLIDRAKLGYLLQGIKVTGIDMERGTLEVEFWKDDIQSHLLAGYEADIQGGPIMRQGSSVEDLLTRDFDVLVNKVIVKNKYFKNFQWQKRENGEFQIIFTFEPSAFAASTGEGATQMRCNECGATFKKKITAKTYEVRCPKCGSYDTEPEV